MTSLACSIPYGSGGLGLHLAELVEHLRAEGSLHRYYSTGIKLDDASGKVVKLNWFGPLQRYTPLRYSPSWSNLVYIEAFDRLVARNLSPDDVFIGFNGQALNSFRCARRLGYRKFELLSANSHVQNVWERHQTALKRYPFEQSWLNRTQVAKTLHEYEFVDTIHVASEYTRQSFINQNISNNKLKRFDLQANPRFKPPVAKLNDGLFRIVYTGSLTVMKGIPVLLEAFGQLKHSSARLTLVGGWSSRGMRHYIQDWLRRDARIQVAPGDPLPHLQAADVYVHPTFEDGFAYAPVEALACGVPVIVTEDTGMKEHVHEGQNGFIVPTGSVEAILERLELLFKKKNL